MMGFQFPDLHPNSAGADPAPISCNGEPVYTILGLFYEVSMTPTLLLTLLKKSEMIITR